MLAFMQKRKWVSLEKGIDGRSQSASLAEAGRAAMRRADPRWANTQTDVIGRFGRAQWNIFVGELGRLIECANAVAAAGAVREGTE